MVLIWLEVKKHACKFHQHVKRVEGDNQGEMRHLSVRKKVAYCCLPFKDFKGKNTLRVGT